MILKISLRAKDGVPKTLVKQKLLLHSLYFPQNTRMLVESRLHSLYVPRNTLMLTESRLHSLYVPQNTLMLTESRLHSLYLVQNTLMLTEGAFHSTKYSGLKFRVFHATNGTVFSGSLDSTRLSSMVIRFQVWRENTKSKGGGLFYLCLLAFRLLDRRR